MDEITNSAEANFDALRNSGRLVDEEYRSGSVQVATGERKAIQIGKSVSVPTIGGDTSVVCFDGLFFPTKIVVDGLDECVLDVFFGVELICGNWFKSAPVDLPETFDVQERPLQVSINDKMFSYRSGIRPGLTLTVAVTNTSKTDKTINVSVEGCKVVLEYGSLNVAAHTSTSKCSRCKQEVKDVLANLDAPAFLQYSTREDHSCTHGKPCVSFGCHECERRAPNEIAWQLNTSLIDMRFTPSKIGYVYCDTSGFNSTKTKFEYLMLCPETARLEGDLLVDGNSISYEIVSEDPIPKRTYPVVKYKVNGGETVFTSKSIQCKVTDKNSPFVACDMVITHTHELIG